MSAHTYRCFEGSIVAGGPFLKNIWGTHPLFKVLGPFEVSRKAAFAAYLYLSSIFGANWRFVMLLQYLVILATLKGLTPLVKYNLLLNKNSPPYNKSDF